jgi:hypothetical protein
MDSRLKKLLEERKVSWNKAKSICRQILSAPPDKEKELADNLIEAVSKNEGSITKKRLLSPKKAIKRLTKQFEKNPKTQYTFDVEDVLSLFMVLWGKEYTESHVERVRRAFPGLMNEESAGYSPTRFRRASLLGP